MTEYQGTDEQGFVYHTDDRNDALSGRRYTSREEAILWEIVRPIQGVGEVADATAEYDVDAIADAILAGYSEGYACTVTDDEFWPIAAEHAR